MVLSDIEIKAEIEAKRLVFHPAVDIDSGRIASSSVDLLLHGDLLILPLGPIPGVTVVPSDEGAMVMNQLYNYGEKRELSPNQPYRMELFRRVIGKTLERVTLPSHIAGRIEGKSSLARYGLAVHVTAPTVLAGFEGHLYLEMYNFGPFFIELQLYMKIAQLVLEHVGLPPSRGYQGQFQSQE